MSKPLVTAYIWSPDKGAGLVRDMRVRWALAEVGQAYDVRLLEWGEQKEPPKSQSCSQRLPSSSSSPW